MSFIKPLCYHCLVSFGLRYRYLIPFFIMIITEVYPQKVKTAHLGVNIVPILFKLLAIFLRSRYRVKFHSFASPTCYTFWIHWPVRNVSIVDCTLKSYTEAKLFTMTIQVKWFLRLLTDWRFFNWNLKLIGNVCYLRYDGKLVEDSKFGVEAFCQGVYQKRGQPKLFKHFMIFSKVMLLNKSLFALRLHSPHPQHTQ